jgi:hypothetical protein
VLNKLISLLPGFAEACRLPSSLLELSFALSIPKMGVMTREKKSLAMLNFARSIASLSRSPSFTHTTDGPQDAERRPWASTTTPTTSLNYIRSINTSLNHWQPRKRKRNAFQPPSQSGSLLAIHIRRRCTSS